MASLATTTTAPPGGSGGGGARPAASLPRRPAGPGGGGGGGARSGEGGWGEDGQASEVSVDATETEADGCGDGEEGELPHFDEWQQRRALSPE